MRNVRRKQVQADRKKRHLVFLTFGILLFIYLTVNMILGENGLLRYLELRSMKSRLMADTSVIKKENDDVKKQMDGMKTEPERIEELAREYGLTKEGELIFKFKEQQ